MAHESAGHARLEDIEFFEAIKEAEIGIGDVLAAYDAAELQYAAAASSIEQATPVICSSTTSAS